MLRPRCAPPVCRGGFTLIELLVVVVIIRVLASMAFLRYQQVKEKRYVAAMESDLRNIVTAQEQFFERQKFYADNVADLSLPLSAGVRVRALSAGDTPPTWEATVQHSQTAVTCTIVVDDDQTATGVITCL